MSDSVQQILKGYKQTEIGVIPEDWDVVEMGSLGSFSKGQGVRKDETLSGHIPCVRYGEIYTYHNDFIRKYNSWISPLVAQTSKRLKKGDLLFTGSGETKEEIGKCVAFLGNEEVYAGGDIVILSPNKGDSKYFGYLFNSQNIVSQKASKGQGDAIVHINSNSLSNIKFPYPEETEQAAIAEALSDTDELIEDLEKLIFKKKAIKQGVMQELLTGKKRLPGFSNKWDRKKLGELLAYEQPVDYIVESAEYSENNNIPVLTAGKSFILGYTNEVNGIYKKLPVIIFDDFTTTSNYVNFPFKVKSSAMKMLTPRKSDIDLRFVFEKMQTLDFKTGDHKRYWISEYQFIEIDTPKLDEQKAISIVLSDMESETENLEYELKKHQQIKIGMMQQLLTGKIRIYESN